MQLFAIGFGSPLLLWGMGVAAAPLVIHLLNRQRYREMNWAAMRWLLAAAQKNSRRIQMEQWLLLLLRTLLLILLVLAMAQPTLEQATGFFLVDTSVTHHILLIDNSMSMQYGESSASRLERAKGIAQSILDEAQKGDVASVVLMGTPTTILVGDPSPYLSAVGEEIEAIRPQDGMASIDQSMDRVAELVKNSRTARKEIYLISDMQRSNWIGNALADDAADSVNTVDTNGANGAAAEGGEGQAALVSTNDATALGRKLQALAGQARFTLIDVGGTNSTNHAVVDFAPVSPLVIAGRPNVWRGTIANFSNEPATIRAELLIDGLAEAAEEISVPAGERSVINFSKALQGTGDRVVGLRIGEDPLLVDNQREVVASVRGTLRVLLVDGEASGERFQSEVDYLRVALSPGRDAKGGNGAGSGRPSTVQTETRLESELLDSNLDEWDLVVLANVGQLTANEISLLSDYLKRGGGILFFVGSQTNIEAFNHFLYADGKGIMPVFLEKRIKADPQQRFFSFDPLNYQDPVIEPFRDSEQAGLLTTKIFEYIKAVVPEVPGNASVNAAKSGEAPSAANGPQETGSSEAKSKDGDALRPRVVLAYDSGDPAILLMDYDRGKVGLVTTSADLDWNGWAVSPSYVPVIQEMLSALIAGRVHRENVRVGETISVPVPREGFEVPATIQPPGEETGVAIKLEDSEGIYYARFSETDRSGIYRLRLGAPLNKVVPVAVGTWPRESNLESTDEKELRSVFPGWNFTFLNQWQGRATLAKSAAPSTKDELFRPLLYLVLGLLFLETYLAWRFGNPS